MSLSSLQGDLKKAISTGDSEAIGQAELELMKKVNKISNGEITSSDDHDIVTRRVIKTQKKEEAVIPKRNPITPLEELILSSDSRYSMETSIKKVERIYEGNDRIELHLQDKGKPFSIFVKFADHLATVAFDFPETYGINDFLDDDLMRVSFGDLSKLMISYFKTHQTYSLYEVALPKRVVMDEEELLLKNSKSWVKQSRGKWDEILQENETTYKLPTNSVYIYGSEGYLLCSELVSWRLSRGYRKCGSGTRLLFAEKQKEKVVELLQKLNYVINE
jgi:hypothetical protein